MSTEDAVRMQSRQIMLWGEARVSPLKHVAPPRSGSQCRTSTWGLFSVQVYSRKETKPLPSPAQKVLRNEDIW